MVTRTLSSLLLLSFLLSAAIGGSTGKIAGVVKDKKTGDPIFGANVRVEGTTLGGSTDFQGKYFIINLPPDTYALTVSIFGGTTDSVALWFKSIGHEAWFYYYLTGMIGISLVVYLFMRDTKADSAMHRHE